MRNEVMFAGSGGQGVITASIILAEAAAIYEGRYVVQSQAYGPEARGGSANSHVIIHDKPIGYPKVQQPQTMVCLTQEAIDRFIGRLRPGGLLLTDRYYVRRLRQLDARIYNLSMYMEVRERVGLPIAFNICVLGALVGLTRIVQPDSIRKVLHHRIPQQYLEKNLQAFDIGLELASTARVWRADVTDLYGSSHLDTGQGLPDPMCRNGIGSK